MFRPYITYGAYWYEPGNCLRNGCRSDHFRLSIPP